jgi:hypothetical protein
VPDNDRSGNTLRLTVERYNDHAWGGVKFGIWDHEWQTWRDDIGWFLSEEAAQQAVDGHANAS